MIRILVGAVLGCVLSLQFVVPGLAQETNAPELNERQASWIREVCPGGLQQEPRLLEGTSAAVVRLESGYSWRGETPALGSQSFEIPVQEGQDLEFTLATVVGTEDVASSPAGALSLIVPEASVDPLEPIRETLGASQTFSYQPEKEGFLRVEIENREDVSVLALLSVDDLSGRAALSELTSGALRSGYIYPPGEKDLFRLRYPEAGYLELRVVMTGLLDFSLRQEGNAGQAAPILSSDPGGPSSSAMQASFFLTKGEYVLGLEGASRESLYYEVCQRSRGYEDIAELDQTEVEIPPGATVTSLIQVEKGRRATLRLRSISTEARVEATVRAAGSKGGGVMPFEIRADAPSGLKELEAGHYLLELRNTVDRRSIIEIGVTVKLQDQGWFRWIAFLCLLLGGLAGGLLYHLASRVPFRPLLRLSYGNPSSVLDLGVALGFGVLAAFIAWVPQLRPFLGIEVIVGDAASSWPNFVTGLGLGVALNLTARGLEARLGWSGEQEAS